MTQKVEFFNLLFVNAVSRFNSGPTVQRFVVEFNEEYFFQYHHPPKIKYRV